MKNSDLWAWPFAIVSVIVGCGPRDPMPIATPEVNRVLQSDVDSLFPKLAGIAGTQFLMGSPISDELSYAYRKSEKPQRMVQVDEFWMARDLVTAEEFSVFLNDVGNSGYFKENTSWVNEHNIEVIDKTYVPRPGAEHSPAYPVTWLGAATYCEWLSERLGHEFRLPTEVEWELTARGRELRAWPWGNQPPLRGGGPRRANEEQRLRWQASQSDPPFRVPDPIDKPIPFYHLHGARWMYTARFQDGKRPWITASVGSFPLNATPDGVYDMLGYIAPQWCSDVYVDPPDVHSQNAIRRYNKDDYVSHVERGSCIVEMDYDIVLKRTNFLLRLLSLEAGSAVYHNTEGRSWSRRGSLSGRFGAIFRVASSVSPLTASR